MDLRGKRETYNGFGEGLARAFELAVTPVVIGAAGYGLDRLFGTSPVLTVAFFLLAIVGVFARMWYSYDAEMRVHESRLSSKREAA